MKKLCGVALAALLLAGCGFGSNSETKTCSIEQQGMKVEMGLTAEDDIIQEFDVNMVIPSSILGIDMSMIPDDQMDAVSALMVSSMGIEENSGLDISIDKFGSDMVMSISGDKSGIKYLSTISGEDIGETEEAKLSETVEEMEAAGATCK